MQQKQTFCELAQGKPNFPREEEKIIAYWREIKAFETQLEKSKGQKPYTFYDGPPFATGKPHYGHILAGTIKDVMCRYATQTGHYVERRFGWDCHGLPVEYIIEKKLNIHTREDVMKLGIKKFNEECRSIVMRCASDWKNTVERMGRWIDFENDYKTMNRSYMESVWWVFNQMHKKKLIYRDFKVLPYSTSLNTPLSNFEAKLNYKNVKDPAIIVSFPMIDDPDNASFLAWTTTPWTLPSNLALCVNENLTYVKFQDQKGNFYICGKTVLQSTKTISKGRKGFKSKIISEMQGKDLVGKKYKPLFPYFETRDHCFRVICDDYVNEAEGTGIVHQAPGFGEDDLRACEVHGIHKRGEEEIVCPIDHNGVFTDEVKDFAGEYVLDANKNIIKMLRKQERLWSDANYEHEYPFCWRSDTPLLYRAIPTWFCRVTDLNERLVANNDKTYWVPSHVKEKRFKNWLANARDWALSRNRYWGCPLPIWMTEDETEWEVIGSVKELEERCGQKVDDIHRENIDDLIIKSKTTGKPMKRVDEVFDCWFESGSMPYASVHYPFAFDDPADFMKERFPADFIAEGLDQTRGWFYTLLVISTALFDEPCWKNLIVNGMVLAEDGQKMSKRLQNYPPPEEIFDNFGADALRIYLCSSPVVHAESLKFSKAGVGFIVSSVLSPWYNAYNFFIENASRYERNYNVKFEYDCNAHEKATNIMDKWILSELQSMVKFFRQEMEAYRLYTVLPKLLKFINLLCNTYVRMNRNRIRGQVSQDDASNSLQALYHVLLTLCRLMSPLSPFIVETMYLNLRSALGKDSELSVHFMPIPDVVDEAIDLNIERRVTNLMQSITLGRYVRDRNHLKTKQPLAELMIVHQDEQFLNDVKGLKEYLETELNVKTVTFSNEMAGYIRLSAEPVFKTLGKKFNKKTGTLSKAIKKLNHEQLLELVTNDELKVCDEVLTKEEVNVIWNFQGDESKWVFGEGNGLIVLMDKRISKELYNEGVAREICNRIQKLRKTGNLVPADRVNVFYDVLDEEKDEISVVFESFGKLIESYTRLTVSPLSSKSAYLGSICEEITTVEGKNVKLVLCVPQVYFNWKSANLSKLKEDEMSAVEMYLQSQDTKTMQQKYPNESLLKFSIDDKKYELTVGKDFVYDVNDLLKEVIDVD